MTDRKPHGMPFESWIDRQIRLAEEAGAFDDLPGAGRPIPDDGGDPDWWLRSYLDREGLSAEALLPESLQIRKELERLPEQVRDARSEAEVRALVAGLNRRIAEYVRFPSEPRLPLRLVEIDGELARWRRG